MSAKCPKCGKIFDSSENECPDCKTVIPQTSTNPSSKKYIDPVKRSSDLDGIDKEFPSSLEGLDKF